MKKILCKIVLGIFLTGAIVTSAEASGLIIDAGQISGVLSRYLKKITETTQKVQQLIQQVKTMDVQGYSLKALQGIAGRYYKLQNIEGIKFNEVVEGTKTKKLNEKKEEAENYKKGSIDLYEAKKAIAEKNLQELKEELEKIEGKIISTTRRCNDLQRQHDSLEADEPGSGSFVIVDLEECKSELETLKNNKKDMEAQKADTENLIRTEKEKIDKFTNNEDEIEKANKKRIEKLKADKDEKDTRVTTGENGTEEKQWDDEDVLDNYKSDEEYQNFMKNYFYNPEDLTGADSFSYENNINRITRNRKYLFVNTAAHLLQVTATTRRELPEKIKTVDAMFEQIINGDSGKLEVIGAYGNVRIENAKALFLYAKLLSAKLQYLAARDLIKSELRKEGTIGSFNSFDLGKYVLTDEDIKNMQDRANNGAKNVDELKPQIKWDGN